ncbi:MAG: hypothetical protein KatS3mg124_0787 [Porticoccaceae bacterium]|nr:MAG: hypothetical protein KatS3mg124_0787 [Porticoccaceae bacterium]
MDGEQPKIWLLDGSVGVTGGFVSAREIARALPGRVVLAAPAAARLPAAHLAEFARVERLPIRPLRRNLVDLLGYLPDLVRAGAGLARLLRRGGAEVLLVNDFYLVQAWVARRLGFRGRILVWVRIDPRRFGAAGQLWLRLMARCADGFVAVSEAVRGRLPRGLSARLLYDPVGSEYLSAPAALAAESRTFALVAHYIPGKGQETALEALDIARREVPELRLELWGGDLGLAKNRAYRAALERRARELGLGDAVRFHGFAPDPRRALAGSSGALVLSRSESFSRTALEAQALGLPVIATRCGGPEEILVDGETGFLVPVGDAAAVARAMVALCRDPARAERLGRAARERVRAHFAPERFARELAALVGGGGEGER